MVSPYSRGERRAAYAREAAAAIDDAAAVLRRLASAAMHVSGRRGDVSAALAGLVEACTRGYRHLPAEVASSALHVVEAIDRASQAAPHRPPMPGV